MVKKSLAVCDGLESIGLTNNGVLWAVVSKSVFRVQFWNLSTSSIVSCYIYTFYVWGPVSVLNLPVLYAFCLAFYGSHEVYVPIFYPYE